MPMDPVATKVMERLEASGRSNVRMDVDGTILWDDPTALTGVQSLRPEMFADALARLDQEAQIRRDAAHLSQASRMPPAPALPPVRWRARRLLLPVFLLLLAIGGAAFVYNASHKAPARTPLGPDCKYDTVCLETYVNDANVAVDTSVSSCNDPLLAGNAPIATATFLVSRCDTAVADRDRLVATAFVANATLQALTSAP